MESHNGYLLFEPWELATLQGGPYKVFTPFWRNALTRWRLAELSEAPRTLSPVKLAGLPLQALALEPRLGWDAGFWEHWQPGEAGAQEALEVFGDGALNGYREQRDLPDRTGTSLLSPHLHFGEIAPWRIAHTLEGMRSAGTAWEPSAWASAHWAPKALRKGVGPRESSLRWSISWLPDTTVAPTPSSRQPCPITSTAASHSALSPCSVTSPT